MNNSSLDAVLEHPSAAPPPARALTVWRRLGLGTGGLPDLGMQFGILLLASPIFNVGLGVSPWIIGLAMALPRFMEMFLDPWVGNLSDRTRSRFGRRHPYILAGGLAGGAVFAVIWWVPAGWSVNAKGAWLIVFSLLQFVAFSFFIVPYSALLAEASDDPVERTKVMSMRTLFTTTCGAAMGWLYWLAQRSAFGDPVHGMRIVGIGFALFMLIGVVVPVLSCPERPVAPPTDGMDAPKESEFQTVKALLKIPEFRGVLYSILAVIGGFALIATLGFYAMTYFAFEGDTKGTAALNGVNGVVATITGAASLPLDGVSGGAHRHVGHPDDLPGDRSRRRDQRLVDAATGAPLLLSGEWSLTNWGLTAFWIFVPSITGEICSVYEKQTGRSLYGSFFGLYNLCQKLAGSLALLVAAAC